MPYVERRHNAGVMAPRWQGMFVLTELRECQRLVCYRYTNPLCTLFRIKKVAGAPGQQDPRR